MRRILSTITLFAALVLSALLFRGRYTHASLFASAAFVLMVVALVITLAVNVPIDRQIQSWTTATLPPDWQAIRNRWEFYHGLRTALSLVALSCLFVSTLATTGRRALDPRGLRHDHSGTSRPTAA